jgi:predicted DNA-binding transcriptional regulator YafY
VRLGYGDRTGNSSTRLVSPLGLAMKGTVWYLVGNTDAGLRTFRVGRVTAVEQTDVAVDRPAGFDLEAQWQRIVADVDELRAPYRVEVRVDADAVQLLRWVFDRRLRVEDEPPDEHGRVAVSIGGQHLEMLTAQLAGFGARLEVTAPAEARAELARIGRDLVACYEG